MKPGDTVYFIVSGRRIAKGTVKNPNGCRVLVLIAGGGLRLCRSRFYPSVEEAEKHLLPPAPAQAAQAEKAVYAPRNHEIAWRPSDFE